MTSIISAADVSALARQFLPRIRIVRSDEVCDDLRDAPEMTVHVMLGAAETHISTLSPDGRFGCGWTALFGWGFLFSLPLEVRGHQRFLEEAEVVVEALHGRVRIYGDVVDTTDWARLAFTSFASSLEDILSRTVGSGSIYSAISLTGPRSMRCLLESAASLRPHMRIKVDPT